MRPSRPTGARRKPATPHRTAGVDRDHDHRHRRHLSLMNPAQGNAQSQPEVADMQQRMRVSADSLARRS